MRHALLWTIAVALLLTACNGGRGTNIHAVSSRLPLEDGAEMIAFAPGDGTVQVAVCRDGKLFGCEAVDEKMRERALLPMGKPVDHPKLAEWRRQLTVIDEVARNPGTDAAALVAALAPLPLKGVRGCRLVAWAKGDPVRAGEVLDELGAVGIDNDSARALIETALAAPDLTDARLAGWVGCPAVGGQSESAVLLIRAPVAGAATWRAAIGAIPHALGSDRLEIYKQAAARLTANAADADLLVGAIERLNGSDRATAALEVIDRPETPAAVSVGYADVIECFHGSDRVRVLRAIIAGPGFTGAGQAACLEAVKQIDSPRERRKILDEIAASSRASEATRDEAVKRLANE